MARRYADPGNKDGLNSRRLCQTHCRQQSVVDHPINRQTATALEGADRPARASADHAIDRARVISSAGEPALHLHNHRDTRAIPVRAVTAIRIVRIGVRVVEREGNERNERKERKPEVIEDNDLVDAPKSIVPIEVAVVETAQSGRGV